MFFQIFHATENIGAAALSTAQNSRSYIHPSIHEFFCVDWIHRPRIDSRKGLFSASNWRADGFRARTERLLGLGAIEGEPSAIPFLLVGDRCAAAAPSSESFMVTMILNPSLVINCGSAAAADGVVVGGGLRLFAGFLLLDGVGIKFGHDIPLVSIKLARCRLRIFIF